MKQIHHDVVAIQVTCPADVVKGEVVELSGADHTVQHLASIGGGSVVGVVETHTFGATICTVATGYNRRTDEDYTAGAAVTPGPFVFGPNGKVFNSSAGSTSKSAGSVAQGAGFVLVDDTNDILKITVEDYATETLDFGAGGLNICGTYTAAQLVALINANATHFYAVETAAHHIDLYPKEMGRSLEVVTDANDFNATCGWAEVVNYGTWPSSAPTAIAGLVLAAADKDAAVDVLVNF